MRLSVRWKLVLWVVVPMVLAAGIITAIAGGGVPADYLAAFSDPQRRKIAWAIVILIGLLIGLVSLVGTHFSRSIERLAASVERLGSGDFSVRVPGAATNDEIGDLSKAFNAMVDELDLRVEELTRATAAREAVDGELRAARKIQASLLPQSFPEHPQFQLLGVNAPDRHVGGDFFDFFFTSEHELVLVIADVSGKGVPAAMLMAVSRTMVHSLARDGLEPAEILNEANRRLVENSIGTMYMTLFVAKYDITSGRFSYANGAHIPPLLVTDRSTVRPIGDATGTLVGIFPDTQFEQGSAQLAAGELLLLYTDGVTEARSPTGEFYGEEPVLRLLSGYSDAPPHFCAISSCGRSMHFKVAIEPMT